jgi:hypothetical protein
MLWTDLLTMKQLLEIDPNDTSQDWLLNHFNLWTTDILETLLNRDFSLNTRTWYYQGTGTQKLILIHRPVQPSSLQVTISDTGYFGFGDYSGSTTLALGVDYTIKPDTPDGWSNEAILYRINDYWPQPSYRQAGLLAPFQGADLGSVMVVSTAGYDIDTLPIQLKMAAELLITRLAYIFPLGLEVTSESYIDRSISLAPTQREYLMGMVKHHVMYYRNWKF